MRGLVTLVAAATTVSVSVALAATTTVTLKDTKGDGSPIDLRSASVRYNGKQVRHVITAGKSFNTQSAPCLVISRPSAPHDLLICFDGQVLGFGPGGPHVKVTRPSKRSIAYTFKPSKLGLKGSSYKWNVNGQGPSDHDRLPNKGCAVERLTTGQGVPNPPKTKPCRKFS
jgi:hypothetical protein